jgi:3-phenylpropionate/cinnamic acid dioxygenase small subunit
MDDLQRIGIELACQRTLVNATHLADFDPPGSSTKMFTEDCTWEFPETGLRVDTRAGLHAHLTGSVYAGAAEKPRNTHHVISNMAVDVVDADNATSLTYWMFVVDQGGTAGRVITTMGHYHDELVRTADGWRIRRRRVFLDMNKA